MTKEERSWVLVFIGVVLMLCAGAALWRMN